METPHLPIVCLPHFEGLALPHYATAGAAGMDLCAAVDAPFELTPGARTLVPTGLSMAVPAGFEAQIRPRSGLALKHGITCLNSPGTIDSDYRGEVKVLLANLGEESFMIDRGMRVAQMVIARYAQATIAVVTELTDTMRGAGGFGSTGKH